MLTKAQIQFLQALQQKKHRQKEGLFVAEGTKIVAEVLLSDFTIHSIYALPNWVDENKEIIRSANLTVITVTESELKKN